MSNNEDQQHPKGGGGDSININKCGLYELYIFLAAIATGTCCSICSKTMMELHGVGLTGHRESFTKPLFQTMGMFVGMMFGLVMHAAVLIFKIPFPGYQHAANGTAPIASTPIAPFAEQHQHHQPQQQHQQQQPQYQHLHPPKSMTYGAVADGGERDKLIQSGKLPTAAAPAGADAAATAATAGTSVPLWMYFFLAIPSIFDLAATALCMMGLRYLDVSIYQLLRGSGIIFVALMKQHVLGDRLYSFQWVGVGWNVVSVFLVGATAILNSASGGGGSDDDDDSTQFAGGQALLGVVLVMAGAFVQALQFVFEEKVMNMEDASAPPLLLIGMEGLWGTALCLLVV
jgi:hypothetical protein